MFFKTTFHDIWPLIPIFPNINSHISLTYRNLNFENQKFIQFTFFLDIMHFFSPSKDFIQKKMTQISRQINYR